MYKGSITCVGCGTSGKHRNRDSAESLCWECNKFLNLGKEITEKEKNKFAHVEAQWYTLRFGHRNPKGQELEGAIYDLLNTLHIKNAPYSERIVLTESSATTASQRWIIRKQYAENIKAIVDVLRSQQELYQKKMEEIEEEKDKVIKKLKNKIYQEGVDKGKSLLIGLNNGSLTLNDFDATQNKY